MKLEELTKDQKSLLLYAETCCVDNAGIYQSEKMNDADRKNLDEWRKTGFMDHGRVASECLKPGRSLWLQMSDAAMALAQELRRERAARMWKNRTWYSTAEKRAELEAMNA